MWRVLLLAVGLPVAQAAEVVVVGSHDAALDAVGQQALVDVLLAAVAHDGAHTAVGPDALAVRLRGREQVVLSDALLADARRLFEDGRVLYQQVQPGDAVAALEQAIGVFEDAAPVVMSAAELWEAWMLLATARLAAGDTGGAGSAAAAAVALRPERHADPALYPPDVLRVHDAEQSLALGDSGVVEVVLPDDLGATVRLDGRDAGRAPARLRGVAPGLHHVQAVTADRRVAYGAVDLRGGGEVTLRLQPAAPTLGPSRSDPAERSQQVAALYRAIGVHARAELILLVGRIDGAVQLQLHVPADGAFSEPVALSTVADGGEYEVAVRSLLRAVGTGGLPTHDGAAPTAIPAEVGANTLLAALLVTPAVPAPRAGAGTTAAGLSQAGTLRARPPRWPVWVGIGVGAAAALGLGLGLGLGFDGPDVSGTVVIGPPLR